MTRTVAIRCASCYRRFGGDQTFAKHRIRNGDRYRCRTDEELVERGLWRDGSNVWHRGTPPAQLSLLGPSEPVRTITEPAPHTLVRTTDPDTSQAAARALSGRAGTLRRRLLEIYASDGHGLTAEEAGMRAGLGAEDGFWKRVSDLLNAGLLFDTGDRRPASSGRMQRVLAVSDTGRRAVNT